VRTSDFRFDLPPELIAQTPAPRRDQSRLLVIRRTGHHFDHQRFQDLPAHLRAGDLLVLNDSRVIPARLRGQNAKSGGQFEILLLEECATNLWWTMMRPGKRAPAGTQIELLDQTGGPTGITAKVTAVNEEGHRQLQWTGTKNLFDKLDHYCKIPLPPYIERDADQPEDVTRYQTVYAGPAGSVAAPTAGFHFTQETLAGLQSRGVGIAYVTLHVGAGTFLPVKVENVADHKMHAERFSIGAATAQAVNTTRKSGGRVIAVGTTATRVLETCARRGGEILNVYEGKTDLFIYPPAQFQIVDALLTNFHLPESTLLMLVSAFAAPGEKDRGRELILSAYAGAIRERYRFYSYGDAMLIL